MRLLKRKNGNNKEEWEEEKNVFSKSKDDNKACTKCRAPR